MSHSGKYSSKKALRSALIVAAILEASGMIVGKSHRLS